MEKKQLWAQVELMRRNIPLVHSIANFVVMNNTANALLAAGASPIMAHAHSEVEDIVALCGATVINIGTLDEYWTESMLKAARKSQQLGSSWVLDPVGAGATSYRNQVLAQLLPLKPSVIRGNASEILALAQHNGPAGKGVDSTAQSEDAIAAARTLQQQFDSIVCISGSTDVIVWYEGAALINNGHPSMTKVTGLGCSASAIIGAFIAGKNVSPESVTAAVALFSICGEIAAENSKGPGSLQLELLDTLYNITEEEFSSRLNMKMVRYEG